MADGNPLIQVDRMVRQRRFRKLSRPALGMALATVAVASMWLRPFVLDVTQRLAGLSDHAMPLAWAAAAYGVNASHRLRKRLLQQHRLSWLASTPIPDVRRRTYDRSVLVWWLATRLIAVAVLIALIASVAEPGRVLKVVVGGGVVVTGLVAGIAGGWWYTESRLASWVQARRGRSPGYRRRPHDQPGSRALQRLCATRLSNEASGQHVASLLAPALLLVPGGTSAGAALCTIGVWLGLILGTDLTRVVRRTLPELALWLAATPLPRGRLIWLLGNGPAAWCATIIAAEILLLVLLGWPPYRAAQGALGAAILGAVGSLIGFRFVHER